MKDFPILSQYHEWRKSIPWSLIENKERWAMRNHGGQSLEMLSKRGGVSPLELLAIIKEKDFFELDQIGITDDMAMQIIDKLIEQILNDHN